MKLSPYKVSFITTPTIPPGCRGGNKRHRPIGGKQEEGEWVEEQERIAGKGFDQTKFLCCVCVYCVISVCLKFRNEQPCTAL